MSKPSNDVLDTASEFNARNRWEPDEAISLAREVMTDCNLHDQVALFDAAPELLTLARALDKCSACANGFKLDNLPELMDGFRAMAAAAIAKAEGRAE